MATRWLLNECPPRAVTTPWSRPPQPLTGLPPAGRSGSPTFFRVLRRIAVMPVVVLALVVQTLALLGLAAAPASAADPLGLESGDLVIADTGHGAVIVVPADGGPDRVLATGLDGPGPVAVTPAGDVVVGETTSGDIQLIRADGSVEQLNVGNYVSGLSTLALDGEGNVLVAGHGWGGIGRVPLTGGFVENLFDSWPVPWYPALAVAADGDIVARELPTSGGEYVVRMDPDGSNREVISELSNDPIAPPGTTPLNIQAVEVTADGRAIVADDGNDAIWESDGAGGLQLYGAGLSTPTALSLDDGTGALYVADLFNNRVVQVSADRSTQADVATDTALLHPGGVAVVPPSPTAVGDIFGVVGGTVYELNPDNTSTVVASGLGAIRGLTVDGTGNLVVATADGSITRIAGDGTGARTVLAAGIAGLTAVAAGPDGGVFYGNEDGEVRRLGVGAPLATGTGPIQAIEIGPDGTPYYSDSVAVTGGVEGSQRTMIAVGSVPGLAWDPTRRLIASTPSMLVRIDPRADPPATAGVSALFDGGPVAVDEQGRLLAPFGSALVREVSAGVFGALYVGADPLTELATYVSRPELTAAEPPATGNVGATYDGYTFAATDPGGLGVGFTVYDGDLPPGLTLDETGELTGEPTTAGPYTFRIQAANAGRAIVSDPITITIGKRLQTIAFDSTIPSPAYVGTTYTPSATGGGSSNEVTFDIDPAAAGVCTYDVGTGEVTFTATGACVVLADQAGDADHEAATQASETVYVTKRDQTITFSTAAPTGTGAEVGDTYTPAATASSGLSPVTFDIHFTTPPGNCTIAAGVVTFLQEGPCRVRARQAGNDEWWPISATQNVTIVEKAAEPTTPATTLAFTSSPPEPAVVGQQYVVAAATTPAGGVVELAASGGCTIAGATVTFAHAGACTVVATSGGLTATQAVTVQKAATGLDVDIDRDVIVATVTVTAPGGGTPTGTVVFSDHGEEIGTGALFVDGAGDVVATLTAALATGEVHSVTATYAGSADHLGSSSAAVSRTDPAITAELTSRKPVSEAGWYRKPVTITFTCTTGTAPLVGGCPDPITLTKNRRGTSPLSFGIVAEDGGAAQVDATVRIDKSKPTAKVRGIKRAARTGDPGKLRCVARDRLSGVDTCTITTRVAGDRVRYRAVALDLAGNRTVVRGRYSLG